MSKLAIVAGATSQSVNVWAQDSSSTVGAGLSGLAYNTASLAAYYSFSGANATATAITLATLAGVTSAWSSGGFIELDATHMKGVYRLDLPNAVIAASKGRSVTVMIYGAANLAPIVLEIELTGWDNQDGVRGGMTALPNAAANAAGGLPISTAGALDLDEMNVDIEAIQTSTAGLTYTVSNKVDANVYTWNGTAVSAPSTAGIPEVNVKNIANTAAAVPGAAGGIPISTAGSLDLDEMNADIEAIQTAVAAIPTTPVTTAHFDTIIGTPVVSVSADLAEIEGETDLIVTATNTGVAPGAAGGLFIAGTNAATAITTGLTAHLIGTVDTLTTYTGNTPQTGDSYALLHGANTELSAVPASTATLVDMLKWIFLLARNKITSTSTTTLAKANDGSTTVGSSTIADDGTTATRGAFS